MPIPIIGKLVKGFIGSGGIIDAANTEFDNTSAGGILNGATEVQTSLSRFDGTGIGSAIFRYTGNFSAEAANINDWFNGRQLNRLRCTSNGGLTPVNFDLPGTTDLTTAFDELATNGLPEVLRFVIEFTGASNSFVRIRPRSSPNPQIQGTSTVVVRTGSAAGIEITRDSGVISNYIHDSIGTISDVAGGTLDSIKLINPRDAVWDASASGPLPSNGVVKGNAYKVTAAPSDGSGRFGEVMQDGDWVVWEGETFTSWSAEPHLWFVLPAHDVRRISALESDFLSFVQVTTPSDRNSVTRGTNYADSAGEIRLKLYATRGDYSAADLNTTGDIDVYTDPADQTAFLGIRLTGTQSAVASVLPTLYVYADDGANNFTRLLNLNDDFTFEGDFGAESDYLSITPITYNANDNLRIFFGTVEDRYLHPNLDVTESNLTDDVQAKLNRTDGGGTTDAERLSALEAKMATLFPLSPDVNRLNEWAAIFNPEQTSGSVTISDGYSLIADYRGAATRYESAGVTYDDTGSNVVTYTGLGDNLYRSFGFKVNAVAQVDDITLTGTSGTANINVDATNYLVTFNTNLTTTASDFVATHGAALNTAGITVTANAAVLTFTADVGGTAFTIAAPVNATGDLAGTLVSVTSEQILMWIVDGSERIPFVDTTTSGNFRINHYTPATTEDQVVSDQIRFLSRTSGDEILNPGTGNLSTFTITAFPMNATQTSRRMQIDVDILVNGTDTRSGHFISIGLPASNTAQDQAEVESTEDLGPRFGNRNVNTTIGYTLRVSGDDLLIDFTLLTAPSDVTVKLTDVADFLSYTAPSAVARVDDFRAFGTAGGTYSFTGENELLFTFQPHNFDNAMNAVGVAIEAGGTVHQFNDVPVPQPVHSFESEEIPDQTALPGFEFRTFSPEHFLIHSDLAHLVTRQDTQWCYGLALLRAIIEDAVTAQVDFTQGIVLTDTSTGDRYLLSVDNGQFKHEVLP